MLTKFKAIFILPLIVHYLSKEDIGIYRIITTSAGFIIPLATLNIFDGSGIFLSADFNKESVSRKFNTLLSSLLYILPVTLSCAACFLFFYSTTHPYWLLITVVILSAVVNKAFLTPYQAYQKSKKIVLINFISEYGSAGLTIIMLLVAYGSFYSLLIPVVVLQTSVTLYLYYDIKKEIKLSYSLDKKFIREVILVSIPLLPVYIGEWLLASIGIFFLEYFNGVKEVGIYSVAFSIASLMLVFRATLQYFWFATSTNLLQNNDIERFGKIYRTTLKIYLTLIVIMIIFYMFFSTLLINILTDSTFLSAQLPIFVLVLGFSLFVLSGIFNGILYGMGQTKKIFYGYLISGLITIATSWILVKNYSVLGAAMSSLMGYFLLCCYLYFMVDERFRFPIKCLINQFCRILFGSLVLTLLLNIFIESDSMRYIIGFIIIILLTVSLLTTKSINLSSIIQLFRKEI